MAAKKSADFLVVGGGIAGVTCAEQLSCLCPDKSIILITASPLIKAVTNFRKVTRALEEFEVSEKPGSYLEELCPNVTVLRDTFVSLDPEAHELQTAKGTTLGYKKLCLCCGGKPKMIAEDDGFVLGIRDTESVQNFQKKLSKAKRIVVVGNGGIATELVYEIEGCNVIWAIKDASISSTFFDEGAGQFFLPLLNKDKQAAQATALPILKRMKYSTALDESEGQSPTEDPSAVCGSALGPDWSSALDIKGSASQVSHNVHVEYECEVQRILNPREFKALSRPASNPHYFETQDDWPVYVQLTNGKLYGCDLIVSATGVVPNTALLDAATFDLAADLGLRVNERMETNVRDVYAAGDVCTTNWEPAPHWFQMRLWTQARQMGAYAGKSMAAPSGDPATLDFCFELFSHVTKFFGFKVVLLGNYKVPQGQGVRGQDYELLVRVTKGHEFVKVVLREGRMEGALLVGETDLEETFENLIINRMDLSAYGEDLLDPNIDIEDYFD